MSTVMSAAKSQEAILNCAKKLLLQDTLRQLEKESIANQRERETYLTPWDAPDAYGDRLRAKRNAAQKQFDAIHCDLSRIHELFKLSQEEN
jgi:hypothetical protein